MDTDIINEGVVIGVKVLGALLLALASKYAPRVVYAIEKKLGVDVPDGWERRGLDLASIAVDYAEEWARGKLHEMASDTELGKKLSSDKLDKAAEFFRKHARGKITKWSEEKIREVIEAKLQDKRRAEAAAEAENLRSLASIVKDSGAAAASAARFDLVELALQGKVKKDADGKWVPIP